MQTTVRKPKHLFTEQAKWKRDHGDQKQTLNSNRAIAFFHKWLPQEEME